MKVTEDEDPQDLVPTSFHNNRKLNFRPTQTPSINYNLLGEEDEYRHQIITPSSNDWKPSAKQRTRNSSNSVTDPSKGKHSQVQFNSEKQQLASQYPGKSPNLTNFEERSGLRSSKIDPIAVEEHSKKAPGCYLQNYPVLQHGTFDTSHFQNINLLDASKPRIANYHTFASENGEFSSLNNQTWDMSAEVGQLHTRGIHSKSQADHIRLQE